MTVLPSPRSLWEREGLFFARRDAFAGADFSVAEKTEAAMGAGGRRQETEKAQDAVTVLGCFDGVHAGHRRLLAAAAKEAEERKLPLTVWSMTGKQGEDPGLLCTEEERRELLLATPARRVVFAPFVQVKNDTCETFVRETLVRTLGTRLAVCGENFRFGRGGTGNAETLRILMRACGGDALVLPLLKCRELLADEKQTPEGVPLSPDLPVSSSGIKKLLRSGRPDLAAKLLGRPFRIEGTVLHGRALGRTLGFPTANLLFPEELVRPRRGVYFGEVTLPGGARYPAVCNLGIRPTVEAEGALLLECCLLGFSGDLYGEKLRVEPAFFYRPEKKFSSPEALRAQVLSDLAAGRRYQARLEGHI